MQMFFKRLWILFLPLGIIINTLNAEDNSSIFMEKKPIIVGMIGGTGKMGTLFRSVLTPYVDQIKVTSEETQKDNISLVEMSDVIIVTVPIENTVDVIREIVPYLREDQLLIDFTSIKKTPCEEMLKSKASVIGMHPMFGPSVKSIKNQNVVICPVREGEWKDWLVNILKHQEANVHEISPEKHDEIMSIVQGLSHFTSLIFADCMLKQGFDMHDAFQLATPFYRMQLYLAGRVLSQPAELYRDIQLENPIFPEILSSFSESFEELKKIVLNKDKDAFVHFFSENEKAFSDIKEKSKKMTDLFIEQIVSEDEGG